MINATVLSAILTIIYITVITVAGELYPPLKEFLPSLDRQKHHGNLSLCSFCGITLGSETKNKDCVSS